MSDEIKVNVEIDPVNEQVVIAAALADQKTATTLIGVVTPSQFLDQDHAQIWDAIVIGVLVFCSSGR